MCEKGPTSPIHYMPFWLTSLDVTVRQRALHSLEWIPFLPRKCPLSDFSLRIIPLTQETGSEASPDKHLMSFTSTPTHYQHRRLEERICGKYACMCINHSCIPWPQPIIAWHVIVLPSIKGENLTAWGNFSSILLSLIFFLIFFPLN